MDEGDGSALLCTYTQALLTCSTTRCDWIMQVMKRSPEVKNVSSYCQELSMLAPLL